MAKLLSYFNLCPIVDQKDYLGVSEDQEKGTIINTLGRNIIIVTKLSSQKQIRSWTVPDRLYTKVVFDGSSNLYVAGFGPKILKCWSEDVEDLKKVKKVKLQKPIQNIINVGRDYALVVFNDGSCAPLSQVLENVKNPEAYSWNGPVKSNIETIQKSEARFDNDNNGFLILFTAANSDAAPATTKMVYYKLSSSAMAGEANIQCVNLTLGNVECLNYCVALGNQGLMLLTIWSDKRMMCLPMRENENSEDVGHFAALLDFVKTDQPFSIAGVSKNYLVIYGSHPTHEGANLVLYNIQYNLVEAKQYFKVYFNNSQLWVLDNNVLLNVGQSLSVIPCHIAEQQILNVIGIKKLWTRSSIERESINSDIYEHLVEFRNEPTEPRSNANKLPEQPLNRPYPLDDFDEKVHDKIEAQQQNVCYELPEGSDDALIVSVNSRANRQLPEPVETIVKALEYQGCSGMAITNKIVPLLVSVDAFEDLRDGAFKRFDTYSEKVLVDCLFKALKRNDTKLINAVIVSECDVELAVQAMKKHNSPDEILVFLDHLYQILTGEQTLPGYKNAADILDVVLNWTATCLDANFTSFVMAKSSSSTIRNRLIAWSTKIENYINNLELLDECSSLIRELTVKRESNALKRQTHHSKWYNVEKIHTASY